MKTREQIIADNPIMRVIERHHIETARSGINVYMSCPFHQERTPSCLVDHKKDRYHCFGCGADGSVIDLMAHLEGKDCREYFRDLAGRRETSVSVPTVKRAVKEPRIGTSQFKLDQRQLHAARLACEHLLSNRALTAKIAASRGWQPATLESLAREGNLGWHEGKLAFNYNTGMKVRWREGEERCFAFAFGKPHCVWRSSMCLSGTKRIVICEGETDAISLIDSGAEVSGETTVVALPSASTIPSDLKELAKYRSVIIAGDNDESGQKAVLAISSALHRVAASISSVAWNKEGGLAA